MTVELTNELPILFPGETTGEDGPELVLLDFDLLLLDRSTGNDSGLMELRLSCPATIAATSAATSALRASSAARLADFLALSLASFALSASIMADDRLFWSGARSTPCAIA